MVFTTPPLLYPPHCTHIAHTQFSSIILKTLQRIIGLGPEETAVSRWICLVGHTQSLRACLVAESCPTLYDPMDCSLPGVSVLGISQAEILEWVAISSRGSS